MSDMGRVRQPSLSGTTRTTIKDAEQYDDLTFVVMKVHESRSDVN